VPAGQQHAAACTSRPRAHANQRKDQLPHRLTVRVQIARRFI
jgi:hypothetical protein